MIRTQEMVPDYYIEHSRDFQVLCRLYDYTYNALKYNVDTMQNVTATPLAKSTILPLIGDKFGIYDKQSYSNRELLTALPSALFYKGSLQSVAILLNAYLYSMNIFDYAVAYHTKDEQSAAEISGLLRREIKTYSIVIVLSTSPSLVELHVLDEYLKMVLPSGMLIHYVFGVNTVVLDKFKYNENVFVYYINTDAGSEIASKQGQYSLSTDTTQSYHDIEFIKRTISNIDTNTVGNGYVAARRVDLGVGDIILHDGVNDLMSDEEKLSLAKYLR